MMAIVEDELEKLLWRAVEFVCLSPAVSSFACMDFVSRVRV